MIGAFLKFDRATGAFLKFDRATLPFLKIDMRNRPPPPIKGPTIEVYILDFFVPPCPSPLVRAPFPELLASRRDLSSHSGHSLSELLGSTAPPPGVSSRNWLLSTAGRGTQPDDHVDHSMSGLKQSLFLPG